MNDALMAGRARRLQQLRLRDLRLLAEIAQHGTLQGVSRALFVSQPAISQALRSLEAAVGVPLASRSRCSSVSGSRTTTKGSERKRL